MKFTIALLLFTAVLAAAIPVTTPDQCESAYTHLNHTTDLG